MNTNEVEWHIRGGLRQPLISYFFAAVTVFVTRHRPSESPNSCKPLPARDLSRCLLVVVCLALLLTHGGPAWAVDVRQTMWGFDGQVVVQRFNIFSILIDNPSANSFEGEIRLTKMVAGKQVDAPIAETVYLGPYQSRWVQLYPYVKSNWETWRVSWGTSAGTSFDPPEPRLGSPAAVLLDDPDGLPQTGGVVAIKRLPDNLFPPHVTATDCLAAVVMDHVPRWDPARQRSFLDWLKRGGRVYLLKTTDGQPVEFTGEFQVLNGTADRSRVGSGSVFRVDRTRRQLDAGFVKLVVEQDAPLAGGEEPDATQKPEPTVEDPDSPLYGYQFSHMKWDPESALLSHLQKMSNPNHSWGLIFLLGVMYLGTLFPGCYIVAWKFKGDIRYTFGFLLAGVLLFSLVFLLVGRRGYNEVTVVHTVALARQQPDGATLDVTQWSNAFVTEGGDYNLEHSGTSRIYSACQDRERVNKEIRNGADAHLLADMPPFSSRPFAHRAIVMAQPIDVAVEEWTTISDLSTPAPAANVREIRRAAAKRPARELKALKLRKGKSFPVAPQNIYAVCGRRLYQLRDQGTHIALDKEVGMLGAVLHVDQFSEFNNSFKYQPSQQPFGPTPWREPKPVDILAEMFYPLLARCLELNDQKEVEFFVLPTDRIRLLVYAPLPETLHLSNPQFDRQHGFVLYSLDLFEPETQ
jgi:hypothetical protein